MKGYQISYFDTAMQTAPTPVRIDKVIQAIKTGVFNNRELSQEIAAIRQEINAPRRNELKKSLPGVTFSGSFIKRSVSQLNEYSGLVCLDFDNVEALAATKQKLSQDKYSYIGFVSPSGNGLKLIVQTDATAATHKNCFAILEEYYKRTYNLNVDKSGKDISRLCFLSHDPELIVNENASTFQYELPHLPAVERKAAMSASTAKSVYDQVEHCIIQIEARQLDITAGYANWQNIAFALANEFTETGRGFFHRVSMYHSEYDTAAADTKYDNAIKTNSGKITIRTFFDCCKSSGIEINPNKNAKITLKKHENNAEKTPQKQKKIAEKPIGKSFERKKEGEEAKIDNAFIQVENYLSGIYDFRLNDVNGELEYKLKESVDYEPCKEENVYVHLQRNGINFSQNKLRALLTSDFVAVYDPFQKYFDELPVYDPLKQPDYITELCTYLKAKEQDRFNRNFKKMLVRSIACALIPGVFNKQAFILVHNKQNSGKSTFCRWLCPSVLSKYYSETFNGDKDSMIALAENFIINLDELASLQKIEINALKTAISKDNVKLRRPYDKRANTYPRRANFVGSTNDLEFLTDRTGNVRWLCFEIESIDFKYSQNIDINNLWAQAYHLYSTGFDYKLSSSELQENETSNESHKVSDPVTELIQKYIEPGESKTDDFLTTTDIIEHIKGKSITAQAHFFNNKTVGAALASLGYHKSKEGNSPANQRYGYWIKKILPEFEYPKK